MTVEKISQWYDVDSLSDLRRLRHGLAGAEGIAHYTRTWLAAAAFDVRDSRGWCENDQEGLT
jgi:hypothetical protein